MKNPLPITPLDHARDLLARGLSPIPVPYQTKAPQIPRWQHLRLTLEDLPRYFNGHPCNIGTLLGKNAGWLVDVDLDHPLAVQMADQFLPPTGMIWGREGKPRSHWLYRVTGPASTRKHAHKSIGTIVELRASNCQTIAPGSTHPTGERVRWDEDGEPATVDPDELSRAVCELKAAVLREVSDSETDTHVPDSPVSLCPYVPVQPGGVATDPGKALSPDEVIELAKVTCRGQHDSMTMTLGRGLKINAGLSVEAARPHFERWWASAKPHCDAQDPDAAWGKFRRCWELARIGIDQGGIAARMLARDDHPAVPEESRYGPGMTGLIRALAAMGKANGGQPFAISAGMVAERFGVSNMTAHYWLTGLALDGLIEVPDRGRSGAAGKRRARRLRWKGGGGGGPRVDGA
jgi:hypothetical protein